jgi:hypothetical protein
MANLKLIPNSSSMSNLIVLEKMNKLRQREIFFKCSLYFYFK